jgi:hypothetical protein
MTRRRERDEPEPPGGRAAERLRDFMRRRYPEGEEPPGPQEEGESEEQEPGEAAEREKRPPD